MHLFEIVPEAARTILSDYFREKVCGRALSTNKYNTSDITSNMIPLLLGGVGTKGALMLGFTAAEVILHYWNSKKIHPEIYIFGRRVHQCNHHSARLIDCVH
jgi:hypothetical protein